MTPGIAMILHTRPAPSNTLRACLRCICRSLAIVLSLVNVLLDTLIRVPGTVLHLVPNINALVVVAPTLGPLVTQVPLPSFSLLALVEGPRSNLSLQTTRKWAPCRLGKKRLDTHCYVSLFCNTYRWPPCLLITCFLLNT